MSNRVLIGLLTFLASLPQHTAAQTSTGGMTIANAERSVVQIINRCSGVSGSGFFWRDTQTIITALHVVGGCGDLRIRIGNVALPAATKRALPAQDLALLQIAARGAPPLQITDRAPATGERVTVLGYPVGVPTRTSATLEVIFSDNSKLAALLPDEARKHLTAARSIDLSTDIVRLGGHLVPGYSGAPIINAHGEVVAVGSGGLLGGLAGIGWGIRAGYVRQLATSNAPIGAAAHANGLLFAFARSDEQPTNIQCGPARFQFVADRQLAVVLETTDDKAGFTALATASGLDPESIGSIEVSIYSDPQSGASFAVPKGVEIRRSGNECKAIIDNDLELRVASAEVRNVPELNDEMERFESDYKRANLIWAIAPAWSYMAPLVRPDGLVSMRKMIGGLAGNTQKGWATETMLERDNLMVGIQLINYDIEADQASLCRFRAADDASCAEQRRKQRIYSAALLGTYLATFPPR